MSRWLKKLKVKTILLAAALWVTAAVGGTFAWQEWELSVTNELKAHDTQVEVEEDFQSYDHKKVGFKNTGTSSVFLRVCYSESWKADENLLPNTVTKTVDSEKKQVPVAIKKWTEFWPEQEDNKSTENDEWVRIGDWYYYKKVLKAGTSTNLILNKVSLLDPLPEEYKNANYDLYFYVEAVQCSDGSNTLNSSEVNREATRKIFGPWAEVDGDTVIWTEE